MRPNHPPRQGHPAGRSVIAGVLCVVLLTMLGVSCAEKESAPGQVEIELWTLALRPRFTEYMQGVLAGFESQHPGVKVRWVDVPFDALNRKLISAAVAGQAPDVVNFSDMQFARFAALGATRDLDGLLETDPRSVYLEGTLAPARINGELGALPWYLTTTARFINTQILTDAGWDPDTIAGDWATLCEQARAYHEQTGGYLFTQALAVESELPTMLIADGRPPFKETDGRLRADLTREDVFEYLNNWVDLYRSGALPREAATSGHAHVVELYQNGRTAVAVTGANFLSRIADAAPDVFRVTKVASPVTGDLHRAHIAVMFLSVTSTSKHPKEAAALAGWITNPENQLAFCKIVNILPSTPSVLGDPHFDPPVGGDDTAESKIALARSLSAGSLPTAVAFTPSLGAWPDLRRAFNEGIKAALLDNQDVRKTLAQIETEWNQILDDALPATLDAVPRPGPVDTHTQATNTGARP